MIAAAVAKVAGMRRAAVLTGTLGLQDQYATTFPFLVDLRGMRNYACLAARDEFRSWFPIRRGTISCEEGPCRDG